MDYQYIINQIYNLIMDNQFLGFAIGIFLVMVLFFIISKTFRKSGLFLLATTFLIDYSIKSLPFDIYGYYPQVQMAILVLYGLGALNFLIRVVIMLVKIKKKLKDEKEKSSLNNFFKFTGCRPFFLMLIINLVNYNNFIPKNILSLLTSLSFLYMAFRTLYSTYLYLSEKESITIKDDMNFEDIKAYLDDERPRKTRENQNKGRVVKKNTRSDSKEEIDFDNKAKEKQNIAGPISISEINKEAKSEEIFKNIKEDILDNEVISFIEKSNPNFTEVSITNLKSKEVHVYTSEKAHFSIEEDDEYKVRLKFDEINDYDYGRFMDLIIAYGVEKEGYKFELRVTSKINQDFKLVFFDPSQIKGIGNDESYNPSGREIVMNFPKYKINLIKGNY